MGPLANLDSWRPITLGLLAKRPSKRPKKDPKNQFTGPNFENTESNRGSWVLILRIRYSSNDNACFTESPKGVRTSLPHRTLSQCRRPGSLRLAVDTIGHFVHVVVSVILGGCHRDDWDQFLLIGSLSAKLLHCIPLSLQPIVIKWV